MQIKCPMCANITTWEENPFRPFCSERCKMIDLGKWASEEYTIHSSSDDNPKSDSVIIEDEQKERDGI
ncbi:MAG: DNA gyrase inhibitor YacG [Dissulfurispiraceae bacterium]|jgi:endogenous inhibitor of DNA gyrase (YacG/DUF329 family)|nr:DNA gyrase inhibitor YacG [Dissulfurispiraceae bacterium]